MLDTVRAFVGADGALLLSWQSDDMAVVLDSSPESLPGRTIRLSRDVLLQNDGVVLNADMPHRLLSSALAFWLPTPLHAASLIFDHTRSETTPTTALLFVWGGGSVVDPQRLHELRPLVGALLGSGVSGRVVSRALRRFDAIMRSAPQGIVFVDQEQGNVEVNAEATRLLGLPKGIVTVTALADAMRLLQRQLTHRERVGAEYARVMSQPDASRRDWIWEFTDAEFTTLRVASVPVAESAGRGRLWTFEDVTAEWKLRRQLELQRDREQSLERQKLEALTRLAAGVAHDFGNIITIIGGSVEMMRDPGSSRDTDADLAAVARATQRADGLIRLLRSFSDRELSPPEVKDLDTMLHAMSATLLGAVEAPYRVQVLPGWSGARVLIDERKLALAIVNLIANSRDRLSAGGTITVRSARVLMTDPNIADSAPALRYAAVTVSDREGPVSSELRESLATPFAGEHSNGTDGGLGLSVVAAMVEQAGGAMRFSTDAVAGGTYTLYLPVVENHASVVRMMTPARGVPVPSDKSELPILVVDDDAGPRRVVRRLLEREGYAVLTAESAGDALRQLEARRGHVLGVISDYLMPGMSGMELLGRVRMRWSELPVVLVSGFTSDDVTGTALRDLRAHFLAKPFTREELLSAFHMATAVIRDTASTAE